MRTAASQKVREWFGIDQPYLFFVGRLEPKKNIFEVLEAARRLGQLLVVAGGPGWRRREIDAVMRAVSRGHCRYVGYVTPSALSALYASAVAFVFPSHDEGFGIPVMEAMACGVPVVTSDVPALREICANSAIHVPAKDTCALTEALREVIKDSRLRTELIRKGQLRSQHFTWERSARCFQRILKKMAVQAVP